MIGRDPHARSPARLQLNEFQLPAKPLTPPEWKTATRKLFYKIRRASTPTPGSSFSQRHPRSTHDGFLPRIGNPARNMTANISIRSAAFPNSYLRLDGRGITKFNKPGSGHVNCQSYVGTYEILQLNKNPDGTFGIRSATFPNVYLRLDAKDFKKSSGQGGGTANCQFGAAEYEKFRLVDQPDGSIAIESVQFPGVYLRMDGTPTPGPFNDPANDNGLGVVNAELSIGPWEKFIINTTTTPLSRPDIDTAIQK